MSVVGFDFGYDTSYVAVARAGGIETIANDYSMRDTPSMVSFAPRNRVIGVGAKQKVLTNLQNTFFGFKPLLGRKFDDPLVQDEARRFLPYPISKAPDGGILLHVDFLDQKRSFSPEQLAAMLFTKLKDVTDTSLQTKIKDVVVSVPVYASDSERRALLDACAIAGLNVLKLMNDTTATALAYGIYKQDLPAPEEKSRNIIFVDCGHRGIQVSATSFNKGKLTMQACTFDRDCGGRVFNEKVAKYFVDDFKARYKFDASTNKKAMLKLMTELERLKKQMSANTNKLPLNIECFMEDRDVTGSIDRALFEELIAPELQRIEAALKECLTATKWKLDDIYAVEIVGGSTRIPAIKTLIEKVFGQAPKTTLNSDEATARGCALQCAILSPTFKVREFSVTDIQPFPIKLKWQAESDAGDMVVFPKFHAVPFSKMLTFYRRDNFSVESEYEDGSSPMPDKHIGSFEVGDVKPMPDGSNQKVKVKVRINLHGIFTVSSASLIEKHEVEEEVPMEVDSPKAETKDPASENGNGAADNAGGEAKPEEAAADAMDQSGKEEKPKMEKRKKTVQKTTDLPIIARVRGAFSHDKLEAAKELERFFVNQDRHEADRLHAMNEVEEYVYDLRNKIGDDLADYVTEDDRSKLSLILEDTETWLYEDGENCEKQAYVDKLKELRVLGDPIKSRKAEADARPAAIEALGHSLQMAEKALDAFRAGDERYAHLDPADMEKVTKTVREKRQWLDDHCAQLAKLPKTANPSVLASQFANEKKSFESVINPILNKPRPKPPAPPAEDAKATADDAAKADAASTEQQSVNREQGGNMDLD